LIDIEIEWITNISWWFSIRYPIEAI